ncbi:MAG: pyridoxamine 5'-phosphate oxidase [Cyclobacteriaceae bacterium]
MKSMIAQLRNEYSKKELRQQDVASNPIDQFKLWFEETLRSEVPEPNAMSLATVDQQGQPSLRVVLLKEVNEHGFVFFTNYQSKKGQSMMHNPLVGLNFFWHDLERQVRIEGSASKISELLSNDYFETRPRGSQIGAWASPQSQPISERSCLEKEQNALEKKFKDKEIPRPEHWGGYLVTPHRIEFWQGRASRLHDRICYQKEDGKWEIKRLAP